jgi:hypothetical protein
MAENVLTICILANSFKMKSLHKIKFSCQVGNILDKSKLLETVREAELGIDLTLT